MLNILRGLNPNVYKVRGHHRHFYAVDLPDWLPHNAVEAIDVQFKLLLQQELTALFKKMKAQKIQEEVFSHLAKEKEKAKADLDLLTGRHSFDSDSGISVSSGGSLLTCQEDDSRYDKGTNSLLGSFK